MQFDGIIVGGGHNGLITAAYLAKAGLKMAVMEGRAMAGGGFANEEVTSPGFKHQLHAHYIKIHESPIHRDMRLADYGVSYVFPEPKMAIVKKDGYFLYHQDKQKTYESIRRISEKDAETYRRMSEIWHRWYVDFVLPEIYSRPKPFDEWRADILAKPDGDAYLDAVTNYSPVEYAEKLFETEYCRLAIIRGAASAEYDVNSKGMPALVFATILNWFNEKTAHAVGGVNRIALALKSIIEENGGLVRLNSKVAKIRVAGGRAVGVTLQDGTEFEAGKFVASSIDPVHTFLFLMDPDDVPPEVAEKAGSFEFSGNSLFRIHLALKERPRFTMAQAEPSIDDAWKLTVGFETPGDFARIGGHIKSGNLPDVTGVDMGLTTVFDPSQAPNGQHVAYVGLPAPFNLADGGADRWPAVAKGLADRMMAKLREYAPNMTDDNIVGRFIYTPKDIEEYLPDMINGDICQGKMSPEQLGYNRPWPGMSHYQTFLPNLYLCGSSTHPGGHAVGGSGYNAANRIAEDLGLAKWWKPFDPKSVVAEWD